MPAASGRSLEKMDEHKAGQHPTRTSQPVCFVSDQQDAWCHHGFTLIMSSRGSKSSITFKAAPVGVSTTIEFFGFPINSAMFSKSVGADTSTLILPIASPDNARQSTSTVPEAGSDVPESETIVLLRSSIKRASVPH